MKKLFSLLPFFMLLLFAGGSSSCGNDKEGNIVYDSTRDTITGVEISDSLKYRFKKLVSAMPVPFDILKKFSGAHFPFKGELLNVPENAPAYSSSDMQSLNLGIYGADLAYMISQDKLGDAAPYLKAIRRLSDEVVVPSAFDANILSRYDFNRDQKDSLQGLVRTSYKRIDSTLQGNDRLALATLVLAGGWIESIYLTTQHIGGEQQNEQNKVLFDMLAVQRPYLDNLSDLSGSFMNDSLCKDLHADFESLKKVFPKGPDIPSKEFADQLKKLSENVAAIRNRYILTR
jgi:hypothetical protein